MGSFGSSGSEVVTVDVQEAKHLLESGYGYLEVRTEEEYKKGHVDAKKILNIPYMFNTPEGRVKNPQFLEEVSSACKKDDLLVVGCQSGVRSLYATADLQATVRILKSVSICAYLGITKPTISLIKTPV
ncbi:unnamed protein product [Malus baccata var. baccata]